MDCLIRDFTKIGAHLHFPEMGSLPDTFELYVPSKDEYFQAHAIWHKGSDVGVAWAPERPTATPPGGGYQSTDPIGDRLAKVEHESRCCTSGSTRCKREPGPAAELSPP
jgi:hypothetical protein